MSLELISHPICPFVHRAAALLHEKGIPFSQRSIDLQAKPDWFLAISPRGKVPVLVADGTPIFESSVIVEYLDETHGPQIVPSDPIERARQRAWVEVANDLLAGHYKIAIAPSPAERDAARTQAREVLRRFEEALVGPFFAGETIGLVDIAAGPGLVRFEKLNEWLELDVYAGLPKVAAWSKRISERPSFRETLVADFDDRFRKLVKTYNVAA
jgi:glutathione S-transferase